MCGKCSIGVCCQNFGGFLGVLAGLGVIYTVSAPDWHRVISSEYKDGYYYYTTTYHGLWMRCFRTTSYGIQCDGYSSPIPGLPGNLLFCIITFLFHIFAMSTAKMKLRLLSYNFSRLEYLCLVIHNSLQLNVCSVLYLPAVLTVPQGIFVGL